MFGDAEHVPDLTTGQRGAHALMNLVVKGAARPDGSQPEPLITPNPSSPQTPHHRGRQPTRHRRHQHRLRRTIQSKRFRSHSTTSTNAANSPTAHHYTPVLPPSNTRCRHVPPTNSDRHQPHHRRQPQHPLLHPVAKTRTHRRSPRPLHQHRLRRTIPPGSKADHTTHPHSRGGPTRLHNGKMKCGPDNQAKGNRTAA